MHKTKRKIFEKSMELFANKGYNSTSIEEITSVVGVAKGTFYYHFSSKEDIFKFLIEEGMKLLTNNIEIKTKKHTNSIDKINAIILIQIKVTYKYGDFIRLIFSEMWGIEERNNLCKKSIEQYINIIEDIVRDGIAKKEITANDAGMISYGIFGVTYSCLLYKQKSKENTDINEIYNEFSKYIMKSLK